MNTIRMIAITLPVMLLLACGGGGGGGTAAVAPITPTNPNPPMDDEPMNPFTQLTQFNPTANSSTIEDVERIALTAGTDLLYSEIYETGSLNETDVVCLGGSCLLNISPISLGFVDATIQRSSNTVGDISFVVAGGNSQTSRSVTSGDATLARGSLTGMHDEDGTSNDTPFAFETFAGWFDDSIFGTVQISTEISGSPQYRFAGYTLGVPATNSPSATGSETSATWEGATVASIKADRTFILGDATIDIDNLASPDVDVMLDNWRNLDNQAVSSVSAISYTDLMLTNGAFEGSGNNQVGGWFYGDGHTEVGGFFNTETVTGAFGGTRQ